MGRKSVLKSAQDDFTPMSLDVNAYMKRMKIQVDEMYRKFRWQLAPGGICEHETLYRMSSEAKRLLTEANVYYKSWSEVVSLGLSRLEAQMGQKFPFEVKDLPEVYAEQALTNVPEEHLNMQHIEATSELVRRAAKIEFYHRLVMGTVDVELPFSTTGK